MTATAISRRSTTPAVALCNLGMMALAIVLNLPALLLTTFSREWGGIAGLSGEQLGRIAAVTCAGLVTGIVLTGPLADRLGARLFAVAGNVLIAIGLAGLAVSPSYDTALMAAFGMGFGAGVLDMILSPIVAALRPGAAPMNLLHSFFCLGGVATILGTEVAFAHGISWRTFSWIILPAPLLVGAGFAFVPLPSLVEAGHVRTSMKTLLRNPFFQLALIAIFLGGATELGMAFWLPAYAEKTLGFSRSIAGLGFLGFTLAMTLGRIIIGLLPPNIGPIRLMIACCAGSVVFFLLASFSPWNSLALSCCVLAGLSGSCLWPSTLAVAAHHFPRGGATMFALLAMLGNFGGIFMPWAVGAVADRSSLRWGLAMAALCPFLMMLVLIQMGRSRAKLELTGIALP